MNDFKVKVDTSELDIMLNKAKELNSYLKEMRSYGVSQKNINRLFKRRMKMVAIVSKNQK